MHHTYAIWMRHIATSNPTMKRIQMWVLSLSRVLIDWCCSVLQCVAVCCSVLQCVAMCCSLEYSLIDVAFMCCSVLQCVAVCCSVLQRVAMCCSVLQSRVLIDWCCFYVLQCVAVCCSVLQRVAVSSTHWLMLLCVAVCCSVLQCVAVCCSVLQRVAVSSTHWLMLLCVAVCCSVLQCVTACCSLEYSLIDVTFMTPYEVVYQLYWQLYLFANISKWEIPRWFSFRCESSFKRELVHWRCFNDSIRNSLAALLAALFVRKYI